LRATNIQDGRLILDSELVYVPEKYVKPVQMLEPGDVVMCMSSGSKQLVGKTAQLNREWEGSFGAFCGAMRFHQVVEARFAGFFFGSPGYRNLVRVRSSGVNINNLRRGDIETLLFPLPPLLEQRRIAGAIETQFTRLDAAVAALERAQANLARYRASVLHAACEGRLVPTEAELARRESRDYEPADELLARILEERRARWEQEQWEKQIERAKKKAAQAERKAAGLPHYIRDLEPEDWEHRTPEEYESYLPKGDKWKEKYEEPEPADMSGLPELPKGWVWARWQQIGFSQNGRAFPSKEYAQSGFKLLRPGNLHGSGRVVWTRDNTRSMPERWAETYPRHVVGPHELVMNLTAQSLKDEFLGRVCLTGPDEECLLNQRIARLTPLEVSSHYLLWMFKSKVFRRFVDGLNTGSLIQHMFTSQLDSFTLPLPPLEEQHRIVREVERRLSVVQVLENAIDAGLARAERLRQAVLKKAFEGRLVPQDPNDEPASVLLERIQKRPGTDSDRDPRQMALV
jgi:type I restriction enzyme S subunit